LFIIVSVQPKFSIYFLLYSICHLIFYIIDERQFEEDAIILKVIEGYCLSVNARFTVHSGESNCKFLKAN